MSLSQNIRTINLLNQYQKSVLDFYDRNRYVIAVGQPSIGLSTALIDYIGHIMSTLENQNIILVTKDGSRQRHYFNIMKSNLLSHHSIFKPSNTTRIDNAMTDSTIECVTPNNLIYKLKGRQISHFFVEDWNGECHFSNRIEEMLPELIPLFMPDTQIILTGTTATPYVSNISTRESLLKSSMENKSHFKYWNFMIDKHVRELVNM